MRTLADSIRFSVNGCVNADWTEWNVDSDLLIPADAFDLALYATQSTPLPPEVEEGAPCTLHIGDELILTGHIDDLDHEVSRERHTVLIAGRDLAGTLTDCSSPLHHATQGDLSDLVSRIAHPLGVTQSRVGTHAFRERIQVEPGRSAWDVIRDVAEAAGLWPWMEPDGTLVIDRPDYQKPTVDHLRIRYDGKGNNVTQLRVRRTSSGRYSEVTVLGQHASFEGNGWTTNRVSLHGYAEDRASKSRGINRPYIAVDPTCDSQAEADRRAEKLLADGVFQAFDVAAIVPGWHAQDGSVWKPGRRVDVTSEPHGIDEALFIRGRRLRLSRTRGRYTELRLCKDKTWLAGVPARHSRRESHEPYTSPY